MIIGVDPHKLFATIEVVNRHEQMLGSGRFTIDRTGVFRVGIPRHTASPVLGASGASVHARCASARGAVGRLLKLIALASGRPDLSTRSAVEISAAMLLIPAVRVPWVKS